MWVDIYTTKKKHKVVGMLCACLEITFLLTILMHLFCTEHMYFCLRLVCWILMTQ